jgi:hypothetical protein
MPNSYESISSFQATGNVADVQFTSIPNTYKHLEIRITCRGGTTDPSGSGETAFYFNTDSGGSSTYPRQLLGAWGSTIYRFVADNTDTLYGPQYMRGGGPSGYFGSAVIKILNYASTSALKVVRVYGGIAGPAATSIVNNSNAQIGGGIWESSASTAINKITFTPNQATFGVNSTFSLYGIKG